MDVNRLNFSDAQNKRYHGRRRNATFGANIRINRNFNRHNDDDSAATVSDCNLVFVSWKNITQNLYFSFFFKSNSKLACASSTRRRNKKPKCKI